MAESKTGVLAMQGAYAKHSESLLRCGASSIEVRTLKDLKRCERLVIPGGESTTIYRLLMKAALWQPLQQRIQAGMPVFGTCAGMILLARHVIGQDQRSLENYGKQPCLAALDLEVRRNAYGRQIDSFSTELDLREQVPENPRFAQLLQEACQGNDGNEAKLPLIFIRAPQAVVWGPDIQVLLRYCGKTSESVHAEPAGLRDGHNYGHNGQAVCLQQSNILVCSFHPELSNNDLLHKYFLSL